MVRAQLHTKLIICCQILSELDCKRNRKRYKPQTVVCIEIAATRVAPTSLWFVVCEHELQRSRKCDKELNNVKFFLHTLYPQGKM